MESSPVQGSQGSNPVQVQDGNPDEGSNPNQTQGSDPSNSEEGSNPAEGSDPDTISQSSDSDEGEDERSRSPSNLGPPIQAIVDDSEIFIRRPLGSIINPSPINNEKTLSSNNSVMLTLQQ